MKTGAIKVISQKQNSDFLQNGSYDFDWISVIYGNHIPE
jgi:hypothetical protein